MDLGAYHQEDEGVDDKSRYLPEVLDGEPGGGAHGKPCPLVTYEDSCSYHCHDTGNMKSVFRYDKRSKSQEQCDEHLQDVVIEALEEKKGQVTEDQTCEEATYHNLQEEKDGCSDV